MESLRFTQRLLHYFEFLLRDYGFVYADEPDLNSSFIDGGRFEGKFCTVHVRLGRTAPLHGSRRHSLAITLADPDGGSGVPVQELVRAMDLDLEPCPVIGEIGTRHMLDLALAYYARVLRTHCDSFFRGELLPSELARAVEQTA